MTTGELALLSDVEVRSRLQNRGFHRHHADEIIRRRDEPDIATRIAVILSLPAPETD